MITKVFKIKVPKEDLMKLLDLTEKAKCLINIGYGNVVASGKSLEGMLSLDNNVEWLFIMHDIDTDDDIRIGERIKETWGVENK